MQATARRTGRLPQHLVRTWRHSPFVLLLLVGVLALSGIHLATAEEAQQNRSRPNIVLIMADDMGFSDLGCYGGEVETPNINRLAEGGLRFTQFYNTARCCPTRACLMTGLYPHQAGVGHMMEDRGLPGYRGDLNDRCLTIAEALKPAGYQTYMSGKWHVTRQVGYWSGAKNLTSNHNWPRQRGFDRFFGTIHGAGSFYDPISLTRDNTPIAPEGDDFYYTTAIAENAAAYIDDAANIRANGKDFPFFLYVAFTAPHWPLHAPSDVVEKYKQRYSAGWDAIREQRRQRQIEFGIIDEQWALTPRDGGVPAWEDEPHQAWRTHAMAVYAAQIDMLDRGVGKILAALKKHDMQENTLIFVLADNGGCAEVIRERWGGLHIPRKTRDGRPVKVGNNPDVMPGNDDDYQSYGVGWANASNTPFRLYKHFVHEGGVSTPLICYWPATIKQHGELTSARGHLVDIMATCLDVARAKYPAERSGKTLTPLAGESLLPALRGESHSRGPIYWEHEGNRAVRDGDWKLVSRYPGDWELYDMRADRTELHDLAAKHPEQVQRLAALYDQWAARSNVVPWKDVIKKK